MKLTKEILDAMSKAIDEMGSQRIFSQKTGIATQNVSKYMNGKVKNIRPEIWKKLYPHIVRWLPSWPGGLPDDGSDIEDETCQRQSVKIFRTDGKIDFTISDSEGLALNLRLSHVLIKKYNYMDNVSKSMFPSQIIAGIKKLLQDVSVDEELFSPVDVKPAVKP